MVDNKNNNKTTKRTKTCITKTRLFKYIENFTTKNWKFSGRNSDNFHISAQNIDCGYSLEPPHRGGSNKYPRSMFLSRNKKNNVYSCKPQFYYLKVGFRQNYIGMFSWCLLPSKVSTMLDRLHQTQDVIQGSAWEKPCKTARPSPFWR